MDKYAGNFLNIRQQAPLASLMISWHFTVSSARHAAVNGFDHMKIEPQFGKVTAPEKAVDFPTSNYCPSECPQKV
jgi:hypothetical protein